ncbi:hypothetical protein O181_012257 [Austropuccinia psidii MF-1]|uniref:FAD-binding FR-type domain-containing protein n=1 Tax=Austropuccinia psidii MF-1 TaxID=1389203 RepID=A0A9Q3GMU9_9BASI|nr:hypothetical protein [Austropuccinia psidii MF-1]
MPNRHVIFHTLWWGTHFALFFFGWWQQETDQRLAVLNRFKYSIWASRGSALCLSVDSSLIFIPIWGGLIYFCERIWREIRGRKKVEILAVLIHPNETFEIRMKRQGFKYVPGQWIFLQMPEVSQFQWHPFTISSAPDDPYISIHVRQVGDFTRAVGARLGATTQLTTVLNEPLQSLNREGGQNTEVSQASTMRSRNLPSIRIDGPYGAPAQDVFECEVAILIGAGIGVTPYSSILKNIYYMQKKGRLRSLRKVQFIWLNKNIKAFSWFQTLLQELERIQPDSSFLKMDMYLTGEVDADTLSNVMLNTCAGSRDALTGLRACTHFGRPRWGQDVFEPIKNAIQSGGWSTLRRPTQATFPILYLRFWLGGPRELAKKLGEECKGATTPSIKFKFYKENCEYSY